MTETRVVVIGAGRMGIGIAQTFAYAGYEPRLVDFKRRPAAEARGRLDAAAAEVEAGLASLAAAGVIDRDDVEPIAGRVSYAAAGDAAPALARADFVFEAVPEVLDSKRDALARLDAAAPPSAVIASTTSTFLADALAELVERPERLLNAHWLNPAYLVPLVEVSPSKLTGRAAVERLLALLRGAGKLPVECAPSPGYIVPRIQALAMNEAARLAEEGVASPQDIDTATRVGFGLRFAVLGLLEFIDWGGADILYYASRYLSSELGDERFAPPASVVERMERGELGMHAGRGFHDFEGRDITAYQRETIARFAGLLRHLGLLAEPGGALRHPRGPAEATRPAPRRGPCR